MTSIAIVNSLLFLLIGAFLLPPGSGLISNATHFQINVASSLCAAYQKYKKTGVFSPPLHDIPEDVPVVQGQQILERKTCKSTGGSPGCIGSFTLINREPPQSRIVGGQNANQFGPNAEFPWDVKLRLIYDWGTFWTHPRPEDFERNNITGLKEEFYGTGVLYSKRIILTDPRTCSMGAGFSTTGNRFVAWFARGRYVSQRWILPKHIKQHKQTANILFDKNIFYDSGNPNRICAISFFEDFIWNEPGEKLYAALEIPRKVIDFTGCDGLFAAWGNTDGNYDTPGSVAVKGPSVLQKLKVRIISHPECKKLVKLTGDVLVDEGVGVNRGFLFCAISDDPLNKRWCYGDWGAPITCTKTENGVQKTYLAGIKSPFYLSKPGDVTKRFDCTRGSTLQFQTMLFASYSSIQWLVEAKGIGYQNPADF